MYRSFKLFGLGAALVVVALAIGHSGQVGTAQEGIPEPIVANPSLSRPSVPEPVIDFVDEIPHDVTQQQLLIIERLAWNALKIIRYALYTLEDLSTRPLVEAADFLFGPAERRWTETALDNRERLLEILRKTWERVCQEAPTCQQKMKFVLENEGDCAEGEGVYAYVRPDVDDTIRLCHPRFINNLDVRGQEMLVHVLTHFGGSSDEVEDPINAHALELILPTLKDLALSLWVPEDFRRPSEALNNARADRHDRVVISAGPYDENLQITKSVSVAGVRGATIKGTKLGEPVILIRSNQPIKVRIANLTITGVKGGKCAVEKPQWICPNGIDVRDWARATITNTTVSGNGRHGIYVRDSAQVTVTNSTVSDNSYHGIAVSDSGQVTVTSSKLSGNTWDGISVWGSGQVTVTNSTVSDISYGIAVSDSGQVTVTNSTISDINYNGISVWDSGQVTVINSTVSHTGDNGIIVWSPGQVTVTNSTVSDTGHDGIIVWSLGQVTVTNSTVSDNSWNGIGVSDSGQVTVTNSTISGNGNDGIAVVKLARARIIGNTIRNNRLYGIWAESPDNIVECRENTVIDNGWEDFNMAAAQKCK